MASLTCTALLEIQKMAFEKERRELLEAAEFEARVAAKLASSSVCQYVPGHCMLTGCAACQLRDARLAVEEEMDAH